MTHRPHPFRCLVHLVPILVIALYQPGPLDAQQLSADERRVQRLLADEKYDEAAQLTERLSRETPDRATVWFGLGIARHGQGRYADAIPAYEKAARLSPRMAATAFYNIACSLARAGNPDAAFAALDRARWLGFSDHDGMRDDPDLASLRDDPRFELPSPRTTHRFRTPLGVEIEYVRVLPHGYDASKTYPVLLALGPGSESLAATDFVLSNYWGEQAARLGWIVLAPARPSSGWRGPEGVRAMGSFLDSMAENYKVESGKFHLGGCSNGGNSAFHLAQHLPSRFHSLTVIPGSTSTDLLERLQGMHVAMYVGEHDGPWVGAAKRAHEKLQELGVNSTLEIVPDQGHVVETLFGDTLIRRMEEFRVPSPLRGQGMDDAHELLDLRR